MAFFALGISTQSQAQTSRLVIKKPTSGTGVILDNEVGGNTIFSIGGNERMYLTSDGKLGIGTTNPLAKLHLGTEGFVNIRLGKYVHFGEVSGSLATVVGNNVKASTTAYNKMEFVNPMDGGQLIKLQYNEGISFHTVGGAVTAGQEYTGYERMRIDLNGNVGIGTTSPSQKLDVYGNIAVSGSTVHTSDARFKKNIQTIDNETVAKLSQVRGTSYQFRTKEFKNKNFSEGKQLGLIAQELMKVYPELVSKGADGYYSVNYTGLIPVLVEAVKDLRKKNADLKDNSQAIKAELDTLKSRMAALEKLLIKAKK